MKDFVRIKRFSESSFFAVSPYNKAFIIINLLDEPIEAKEFSISLTTKRPIGL